MKKSILISVGVLTILIIVGVWAYLFMFGAPKSGDGIFANFGGGNDDITITQQENSIVDVENTSQSGIKQALKQLTTRPVAGAGFSEGGISYVEQGTGHLYHINLATGEEEIVSGTTILGAHEAHFSKNGEWVAISTLVNGEKKTVVGMAGTYEGTWKGVALPVGATEITFMSATGTLNYFLKKEDGGTAYSYNIIKDSNTELFTIPLRDVHILFGKDTYVYTTPTSFQFGYIYKVVNGALSYVTGGMKGLMGVLTEKGLVITGNSGSELVSTFLTGGEVSTLPLFFITEKCTLSSVATFCAIPSNIINIESFPDDWYKGVVSYSDSLWAFDTMHGSAIVLSNFTNDSGREIDVYKIGTDIHGEYVYFINKNDNTLWMFDTTI